MIHADFTYDGISCDEYGVYIGEFNNFEVGKTGASNKTSLSASCSRLGDTFLITSQPYASPLEFEIQVFARDFGYISPDHERALKKWLMQRNKYKWFTILDSRFSGLWFKANIHSPENIRVNDVVGISFQVSCSAPFAYSDEIEEHYEFTDTDRKAELYIDNDESSVIYPEMEITMLSDGDLEIINDRDPYLKNTFKIKGLKAGEVIKVNNEIPTLESSEDTLLKNVYDRFSKYWFFLVDGKNNITVSNNCILTLKYREKRKVGVC